MPQGVPVPLFFWPAFVVLTAVALFHVPIAPNVQLSLAAALMLIGGLPHGAFDIALAREALRLTWPSALMALGAYIAVALLMIALWATAPSPLYVSFWGCRPSILAMIGK